MTSDKAWHTHTSLGKVVSVEGRSAFIIDLGEGRPILLIHGWGSSSFTWRRNYHALSSHFRVVAPDLPGLGLSEPLRVGFKLPSVTEHLLGLAEALNLRKFCVVGHSMGGAIATYLAARHPEKVERLVLINPSLHGTEDGKGPPFAWLIKNSLIAKLASYIILRRYFVKRALTSATWKKDVIDDEAITGYYMSIKRSGPTLLEAVNIIEGFNPSLLNEVRSPTLFILGEQDRWVPIDRSRQLAEKAGAKVILIPDAGHLAHEEKYETINNILINYLNT